MQWDELLLNARLLALTGERGYGMIEAGALAWKDGILRYVGPAAELPGRSDELAGHVSSVHGALVTPALIDCHTHLVFGGLRANEFEQRLEGVDYATIARNGGGIVSTVKATRAADEDALFAQSLPRARALVASGAATLEIKSGYGLELKAERRMLRVARRIGEELGITVCTSFLGLHALPPEYANDRDGYVTVVCEHMLPALVEEGLVDAVDAFCETIGFTPTETRRLFVAAQKLGIPVKLHAEQLSNQGGAVLVAGFGGLSADHLEYLDETGVAAMADAGVVATLLPGAFYALRETRLPPIAVLRERHVPIALATDLNPGTSPLLSLRMVMNLACTLFRLTPAEALRGVTVNAARALGLDDRGRLQVGLRADIAVWDVRDPAELAYWIGGHPARRVIAGGKSALV